MTLRFEQRFHGLRVEGPHWRGLELCATDQLELCVGMGTKLNSGIGACAHLPLGLEIRMLYLPPCALPEAVAGAAGCLAAEWAEAFSRQLHRAC